MSEQEVEKDSDNEMNIFTNPYFVLWYGINHLSSVVIPVALTMLFSTILVNGVRPSGFIDQLEQGLTVYMVYKEEAEDAWTSFWQAVINALAIVCVIGLMTFVIVLLYKYNCLKVLWGFMYFATFMAIGYTGWFVFYMAAIQYKISCDIISSAFVFANFGLVAVISVFGTYAPKWIKQSSLVIISCLVCYLLSFFPDWTTWVLLVAMALYDMCAVLTPCGPLKLLINISRTRDDQIPGLLYETTMDNSDNPYLEVEEEEEKGEEGKGEGEEGKGEEKEGKEEEGKGEGEKKGEGEEKEKEEKHEEADAGVITDGDYEEESDDNSVNHIFERRSVSLGLGDFIFYSLMVSKASLISSVPFVCVFVIILSGLLITMALLSVFEMALPALPFSMILGVATYVIARFVITAMANAFSMNGIIV